MRDLEDEQVLGDFRGREGDIVSGIIQQGRDPRTVLVDFGAVEGVLPQAEQVPGERYLHGERLRCYVVSVKRGPKGPQIGLSRTHPNLVRKLFALEVPEVADGTVEMAELRGEKIDIVEYSEDPAAFVAAALSPAKVISVEIVDRAARSARVVVPDYQLSLAICKEGQNARLAAKLTGWRIDIRSDTAPDLGPAASADAPGSR